MKIVSLGTNCEVSYFIEQFTNAPLDSYISSWARMNFDTISSLDILDDPKSVLDSEWSILPWGMFKNERFNVGFHSKKTKEELFPSGGKEYDKTVYDEALTELKSRVNHLADKMERLYKNDAEENILFVCKVAESYEKIIVYLTKLSLILKKKVKRGNWLLLALVVGKDVSEKINSIGISPNLLVCGVDFLQNPPIKRRGGFDLVNWEKAFCLAIKRLRGMAKEEEINLIDDLGKKSWNIVKTGDAIGDFDGKLLTCASKEDYYYGITFDIKDVKKVEGKRICIHLSISNVQSERYNVGYLQIWANSKEKPETHSLFLENIKKDKTDYWVWYGISNNDLTRLRIVVQTKNGSFQIDQLETTISYL